MSGQDEQYQLWSNVFGNDTATVWDALEEEIAPPAGFRLRSDSRDRRWRWLAMTAAGLAGLSLLWNWHISIELTNTRIEYALALLEMNSSPIRLNALARIGDNELSTDSITVLRKTVAKSRDPNVQLAALDILLDSGNLDSQQAAEALLQQVIYNNAFVRISLRMRSDQT